MFLSDVFGEAVQDSPMIKDQETNCQNKATLAPAKTNLSQTRNKGLE